MLGDGRAGGVVHAAPEVAADGEEEGGKEEAHAYHDDVRGERRQVYDAMGCCPAGGAAGGWADKSTWPAAAEIREAQRRGEREKEMQRAH